MSTEAVDRDVELSKLSVAELLRAVKERDREIAALIVERDTLQRRITALARLCDPINDPRNSDEPEWAQQAPGGPA